MIVRRSHPWAGDHENRRTQRCVPEAFLIQSKPVAFWFCNYYARLGPFQWKLGPVREAIRRFSGKCLKRGLNQVTSSETLPSGQRKNLHLWVITYHFRWRDCCHFERNERPARCQFPGLCCRAGDVLLIAGSLYTAGTAIPAKAHHSSLLLNNSRVRES